MRRLGIILLAGLLSLTITVLFSGQSLADQSSGLGLGATAVFALGSEASVPVLQVHKFGGGSGFRGGLYFGGFPGRGYGWYGGYPSGYSGYGYSGSYLDTPTKTCVWNGYKYRCYNFQSGDSYLY
ncbi:MAG: hypothetical protein HY913_14985 [Desulfomonile tiedjei]|nr:hypothetical protein [Desulfomonile tiedjei]